MIIICRNKVMMISRFLTTRNRKESLRSRVKKKWAAIESCVTLPALFENILINFHLFFVPFFIFGFYLLLKKKRKSKTISPFFFNSMKRKGIVFEEALLFHWPRKVCGVRRDIFI